MYPVRRTFPYFAAVAERTVLAHHATGERMVRHGATYKPAREHFMLSIHPPFALRTPFNLKQLCLSFPCYDCACTLKGARYAVYLPF